MGLVVANDGIFWIEDVDFVLAYNCLSISVVRDDWVDNYLENLNDNGMTKIISLTLA